jgi:hypothetical protein
LNLKPTVLIEEDVSEKSEPILEKSSDSSHNIDRYELDK